VGVVKPEIGHKIYRIRDIVGYLPKPRSGYFKPTLAQRVVFSAFYEPHVLGGFICFDIQRVN
jgi:hypothetical protein